MIIQSHFKEYNVKFEKNESFILNLYTLDNVFFVIDSFVYDLYKESILSNVSLEKIWLLDAKEDNKTIQTVLDICEKMTQLSAKRNIKLVSIGGGITQDITGVVANLLYRGIQWTFIPTTLLAACDSCIGGKTSLNYKNFKNLLGTFYPPDEIIIYPDFLKTLTNNDYLSGLGEVVKFNIMRGRGGIDRLKVDLTALLDRKSDVVTRYIESSLEFKKKYIEQDEFDNGVRVYLNFAHTFGHAIESVTKYKVPHGTAVAMGTIVANYISLIRGIMSKDVFDEIEEIIIPIIPANYNISQLTVDELIVGIRKDKKQIGNQIRAVLLDEEFELRIVEDLSIDEIDKSYSYLKSILK